MTPTSFRDIAEIIAHGDARDLQEIRKGIEEEMVIRSGSETSEAQEEAVIRRRVLDIREITSDQLRVLLTQIEQREIVLRTASSLPRSPSASMEGTSLLPRDVTFGPGEKTLLGQPVPPALRAAIDAARGRREEEDQPRKDAPGIFKRILKWLKRS